MSHDVLDVLVNAALNPVQTSSFIALRRLHERADVLRSRSVDGRAALTLAHCLNVPCHWELLVSVHQLFLLFKLLTKTRRAGYVT